MRTTLIVVMLVLVQYSTHTISWDSHHIPLDLDGDDVIKTMRSFDEVIQIKGYSLTLAVDRPGFWSGIRNSYRMRVAQDKERKVIIEDKRRYYGRIAGGLSETSKVKPDERIGFPFEAQYLEKLPNTYIEILQGSTVVRFHSDGGFTVEAEGKPDRGGFIRLLPSPNCPPLTWSEISLRALGRGIAKELGKGISATLLEDGRIHLTARHKEWRDGEWRLVVDPKNQYLVVQAELIDVTSGEVVEKWHNSGTIGDSIPLARNAVWVKGDNTLIVECLDYQPCFTEEWYQKVESFVSNPPSGAVIRDLRVEPFVDFRVR